MTAESSDLFTITSSDKTTPEHNKGDNEDMDDIVKALTDFSAGNNNGETDDDSLLENNIVTISYTQTVRFPILYVATNSMPCPSYRAHHQHHQITTRKKTTRRKRMQKMKQKKKQR